jgi:hypothetical protein
VAKLEGMSVTQALALCEKRGSISLLGGMIFSPSTDWFQGGPIIERENITLIRANDDYKVDRHGFTTSKHIPQWFASKDTGHDIRTSYEGEYFDPCFMIEEGEGVYGETPLIAAMRCYVASKLGETAEVPEELP